MSGEAENLEFLKQDQTIIFNSNNKFMTTDHDLRLLAESWEKLQNSEPGIKTSFAQGYKAALQEINKIKKFMITKTEPQEWEIFLDTSYFDMFCVRQKNDKEFNSPRSFHLALKEDAENFKKLIEKAK